MSDLRRLIAKELKVDRRDVELKCKDRMLIDENDLPNPKNGDLLIAKILK